MDASCHAIPPLHVTMLCPELTQILQETRTAGLLFWKPIPVTGLPVSMTGCLCTTAPPSGALYMHGT